jgi:DNA-binding MarR family transcriptional regulator
MEPEDYVAGRAELDALMSADMRELTSESDKIGRVFQGSHDVRHNDFRALLHVMVAETAGAPISAGELGHQMGLSGAGITYLVDRLIESGHIRREPHPGDRRKVILHYADRGLDTVNAFFGPLREHVRESLSDLPDADLAAAHRVFTGILAGMRRFQDELGTGASDH